MQVLRHPWSIAGGFAVLISLLALGGAAARIELATGVEGEGTVGESDDLHARDAWFYGQRAYPDASIPRGALARAETQARALRSTRAAAAAGGSSASPSPSLNWTPIGPKPIGSQTATSVYMGQLPLAGRVNAVAVDAGDASTAYVGGAFGGVWKTTDAGATWTPIFDSQPSLAIGAIAIDPSNSSTLYVGTGEANDALDSYYGAGVFKSTDGGANWSKVGGTTFDGCHVSDMAVAGGVVLAAVSEWAGVRNPACPALSRGLWRSADGGATWTKDAVVSLYNSPVDLAVDPNHPAIWYAAFWADGVYKSTDSGVTWTHLGGGVPVGTIELIGRVSVDVGKTPPGSDPSPRVYALVESRSNGAVYGAYASTDGGTTWSKLTTATLGADVCGFGYGGQCWYDNNVAVDPSNASTVYLAGTTMYKSTNGGASFVQVGFRANGSEAAIHTDFHALAFDAAGRLWIGNDGGVYRTADGGLTFADLNAALGLAQFNPGISGTLGGPLVAGTQDNGTDTYSGSASWKQIWGGDGGATAIDPADPNVIYTVYTGKAIYKTTNGGLSWAYTSFPIASSNESSQFYPPLIMSPTSASTLYFGATHVWRTKDAGASWTPLGTGFPSTTVTAIGPTTDDSTIYAGAHDGELQVTTNGGATWTPSTGLPGRHVTDIEARPNVPTTAYATFSGFGSTTPANPGHVFKTANGGATWTNVSGNLPDTPVNAVSVDYRTTPETLYAGTDVGVFWSADGGTTWANTSTGLPNTAVVDLRLDTATNKLVAATHGRGAFTAPAFWTPAAPAVKTGDATDVTISSATVGGTVKTNGSATTARFEYGTSTAYGAATDAQSLAAGDGELPVTATLAALAPETTYHYRLVATNAGGTSYGDDKTFTTLAPPPPPPPPPAPPPPPKLSIDDVTLSEGDSGTTDAVFTVTLSAPSDTLVTVDYAADDGTATAWSDYVPVSGTVAIAPGLTTGTISVPVFGDTDYEPDETFVVDLSNPIGATIAGGEGKGTILNDDPALPSATTRPASMITFSSAKLKGKANPNGAPTTIYFEYGTTKRYGSVTAAQQIGDGTSYVPVSARVRGLAESTTYHFRLVATSAGGTRHGMDRSFTTLAAPRVTVCYHRRTLVVRQSQLRWYLRRGAYIGACRS